MNKISIHKTQAFYLIMAGQLVSTIGSNMTRFGLGLWVLAETGDVGAYTGLLFFAVLPLGLGSLFAGPLVDRWNRRWTLIVSNTIASLSTLLVALLFFTDTLALWHLYLALAVNGVANAFVFPALDASIPLLVEKEQLGRAAGLTQMIQALEMIVGPALAAVIVGRFGLGAIFVADFVTFGAVILALWLSAIPQPLRDLTAEAHQTVWQSFVFGVQYIQQRPPFLYLIGFVTVAMFLMPGIGYALITPLVLSIASEEAAGLVLSSFGVGSLVAGILLAAWGGPQKRMSGMLVATVFAGLSTIVVGLSESIPLMALGAAGIGMSLIFMVGLNRVIWQVKADPELLGRIFSLRVVLGVGAQSLGILMAGPLAQYLFEPLMLEGTWLADTVGPFIGTGPGRGMALIYVISGLFIIALAIISALFPQVRLMEEQLPDYVPPTAPTVANQAEAAAA